MEEFSPLFITMCEKAYLLQKVWSPVMRDYYYDKSCGQINQIHSEIKNKEKDELKSTSIWLPAGDSEVRAEIQGSRPSTVVIGNKIAYSQELKNGTIKMSED
jgi:hypothetical protein